LWCISRCKSIPTFSGQFLDRHQRGLFDRFLLPILALNFVLLNPSYTQGSYLEYIFASCSEEFGLRTYDALMELPPMRTTYDDHIGAISGFEKPGK